MSEVDTVQVEEKKTFISRPYSNAERIKKDEEELEEMLRQQKGEVSEEEEEQEAEPTTAEERSFKKRYGDLRRHTQKQQEDLQSQIS